MRVTREDPSQVLRGLTRNVVTVGEPSLPSENVLHRWNLTERFEDDPEGALAALHQGVVAGRGGRNEVFALAELSFKHAGDAHRERRQAYYLASAVYAYAFLFPAGADRVPDALDPRVRVAGNVYNRALVEAFASKDGTTVELQAGTYALPFGQIEIALDPERLRWADRDLYEFVPVADLEVRGLGARYRRSGIGAPLAARTRLRGPLRDVDRYLAKQAKVPVTALLVVPDPRRQLAAPVLHASLDAYSGWDRDTIEIDGRRVSLEKEPTAVLAYLLSDSPVWSWELKGFLFGDLLSQQRTTLAFLQPHQPGRIPVVFVHGTASSPGRWADMLNDLMSDRRIRERFEFWFFSYTTGNPIPYSAMLLRDSLTEAVALLDPDGKDAALHDMVVIGHSQGGLLTKMTAIDSGEQLWHGFSSRPLDQLHVNDATRDLLRRTLFVEPLPFVRRLVFLATPHRGSYVAAWSLSQLVQSFAKLPGNILGAMTDVATLNADAVRLDPKRPRIGAVYGMSPGSPFVQTLVTIPVAPGVPAHSIIPVIGGTPSDGAADGVVKYASAHVDGVVSELIVDSGHSCQSNPLVIGEVERILLEHAAESCRSSGIGCGPAPDGPPAHAAGGPS